MIVYQDNEIIIETHISEARTAKHGFMKCAEEWSDGNECTTLILDNESVNSVVCKRLYYKPGSVSVSYICAICAQGIKTHPLHRTSLMGTSEPPHKEGMQAAWRQLPESAPPE